MDVGASFMDESMATSGNDGRVGLWTVSTGAQQESLDGQGTSLNRVAFSPDGLTLVATGSDNHIRVWDFSDDTANLAHRLPGGDGATTLVEK